MYGQVIPLKKIRIETSELMNHLKELKQAFMKQGYQDQFLDKQFDRLFTIQKKSLLKTKLNSSTNQIPLVLTFNKTL